jgi:drug/metabolite transporter (DMT)-like permease
VIRATPDRATIIAFLGIVALGGFNAVAIRFSNRELAPFWGATLRFAVAALVLFGIVFARRVPLPRGRALVGSLLYGLLGFAGAFALAYFGLVQTPAGVAQVILAVVPLLTAVFAIALGLEHLRWQSIGGSIIAIGGIALVFGDRLGAAAPAVSMLAILGAAVCMSAANVVVKRFPKCHPEANNAIAMGVGAATLALLSFISGEAHPVPAATQTWVAIGYLAVPGSVVVFSLFLYVIQRWTASATSYVMLLMPLVTVVAGASLAGEGVTPLFVVGAALVLVGVYVGAFAPRVHLPGVATSKAGTSPPQVGPSAPEPSVPSRSTVAAAQAPGGRDPVVPGCA